MVGTTNDFLTDMDHRRGIVAVIQLKPNKTLGLDSIPCDFQVPRDFIKQDATMLINYVTDIDDCLIAWVMCQIIPAIGEIIYHLWEIFKLLPCDRALDY